MQKCTQNLVGKPEKGKTTGKLRNKWKGNVNINLKEIWYEDMGWMYLDHDVFSGVFVRS
jgi:hypothetical protein